MNKRLIFIFLIAGLIAAKGLFADGPKIGSSFQDEFNCENPVIGELLVKLMSAEDNKLRLLKLNHQNKMEVATLDVAGDGVIEFNNVGFGGLENIFNKNNYKITKVESLQSVFENGKNKGKSPEGATGLRSYTNAPIMKIGFEKINMAKGEKTFTAQRRDIRTDYRENKRYNFQSLSRIINYKREINRFLPVLSNFVSENNRSAIEGNKVEFIIPVCHNVKPTSYTPSPQYVNDPAFSYGDVWALKNWFGFYYGLIDVDLNYNDGWRMMYQVWRLLPPERRVMSIVGAGLDDRPGLQQNLDVVNVINGSYVASGLGAGEYYDFLGSNHELAVTSIALAGNNNLLGMPGFTTGRAFLSVCNDGTPVTNADFIEAIDQAANYSALVNISYTYSGNDPAIYQVLDSLGPRNVIAVFGAANDGLNLDSIIPGEPRGHPCRLSDTLSNILCVAGIDPGGNLATSFVGGARTNWGDIRVHTAAPAQDVLIARPGGYLVTAGGTSYAAPFISGMMAAVRDFRPSLTIYEIRDLIKDPSNNRITLPAPLPVVTGSIPDFKKILDAAEALVPCGDVNKNGYIDITDALAIARSVVGLIPIRDSVADDYNGDGTISVLDVLSLAQKAAGLSVIDSCPGSRVN